MSENKIELEITVDDEGYSVESTVLDNVTHEDYGLLLLALEETTQSLIQRRIETVARGAEE